MARLLALGLGYSARRFVALHGGCFEAVTGTARTDARVAAHRAAGIEAHRFDETADDAPADGLAAALAGATHLLVSTPPASDGPPVPPAIAQALAGAERLAWIGYLSSVVVYGDRAGGLVDEGDAPAPSSARGRRRLAAEDGWRAVAAVRGVPCQVFRLAGIYGPGRNALVTLAAGRARRIVKPGQVFNRIHVDDIAAALAAAIGRPDAGPLFSLADLEPAPSSEVVGFAAGLLGVVPPPEVPFEAAAMSEMAASFWADTKRVDGARTRAALGLTLAYPTYREGLRALAAAGEGQKPSSGGKQEPGGARSFRALHPPETEPASTTMDKDRIAGAATQAKGAIKDAAGKVTGDQKLQAEGKADKVAGKAQSAVGGAKDTIRDALKK